MSTAPELQREGAVFGQGRFPVIAERLRYPLAVYLASRVLYLAIAVIDVPLRHWTLAKALRQWDGKWYVLAAHNGYPHSLPTAYNHWSTLGFEPLYPMLMWLGGEILPRGVEVSGVLISLVCGAIATVEMSILAERWWGRAASRRGVLFFCFFPGTIVFSMVYTEGLTLALVAGAMLCLEDRRWTWAGLLAGLATATEPVAFAIMPACAAVSLRELWRSGRALTGAQALTNARAQTGARTLTGGRAQTGGRALTGGRAQTGGRALTGLPGAILAGLRDPEARRSLWAPILSPVGAIGVGIFFWFWAGTPLANYKAQRIAWGEKSSILAVYIQLRTFVNEFVKWHGWGNINLNLPAGFLGAFFMVWAVRQLWKLRRGMPALELTAEGAGTALVGHGVSLGAWVWTLCVCFLTFTSDKTPPNPRMLICAFPLIFAVAAPRTGRSQRILLGISVILLIAMSIGTFADGSLRP
jgi:hypothetical protein